MKASVIPSADILKYMNQARTDPVGFSKYVQKELDSFINDHEMPLFKNCNYITNEGKKAWMEAVAFLQKHPPMTAFKINAGLSKAAEDHGYDMMQHNFFGHTSSNGTSFDKRIDFRCGPAYGAKG